MLACTVDARLGQSGEGPAGAARGRPLALMSAESLNFLAFYFESLIKALVNKSL